MNVIGISAFYHDSAAVLLRDGCIVAAVQEERFTRLKHDASFPFNALKYCLSCLDGDLDAVVFYEKPLLKFERVLRNAFSVAPLGFRAFTAAIPEWTQQKLWIPFIIEKTFAQLGLNVRGKIFFTTHHESHAASAFFASPFQRAAVLTLDGVGEWTTTSLGYGEGSSLHLLKELKYPDSLGLLYSAFTYYCGFRVNSGEYKLMGLAPYGSPKYKELILEELVDLKDDGSFALNMDYFAYCRGQRMTSSRFHRLFGAPPRRPESELTEKQCDLAKSVQEVLELIVLKMAKTLKQLTGEDALCMAGGVALNCVSNARLLRDGPFSTIWVQPASGDAGGALGAALAFYYSSSPRSYCSKDLMQGSALGPAYSDEEIESVLNEMGVSYQKMDTEASLYAELSQALSQEKVVGCFQGRAEFGPRALGNRSILGDARSPKMQKTLNLKIKYRESFRPFAPIVLAEHASDYFDLQQPSPYMLFTATLRSERRIPVPDAASMMETLGQVRSDIPAVTHVDYSARVQTVHREIHPELHRLLTAFYEITGVPVLINTSFNVRGEPPVCSPRDAVLCFLQTEMDCLALGSFWIEKTNISPTLATSVQQQVYAPD
ncbi:MAG: carbamoyltransferase [Opitutales bacterium]|nr:carbamoyltransferase [Opitutales bacterium]